MANQDITLLDCTLRDGGYYNQWCYSDQLVTDYLLAMQAAAINYVELGFRSLDSSGFRGAFAYTTDHFLNKLIIPQGVKVGVMINCSELNHADLSIEVLLTSLFLPASQSKVSLVRIAAHVDELKIALIAAQWLKLQGYRVGVNLMQIADRSLHEIEQLSLQVASSGMDVLYFADSMGSLNTKRTADIVSALKTHWHGAIGIHAHDSMGLALSNTMQAAESGATWLDSTVTGMGRGPGNVKTELLLIELAEKRTPASQLTSLFTLINKHFLLLKQQYGWGTNPYYFLAGKYGIHPSYVQEMLADARYREEDILIAIDYLRDAGAKKFNLHTLDGARHFYHGDPHGAWDPQSAFADHEVLIIGAGESVSTHRIAIEDYIQRKQPIVIALNTSEQIRPELIHFRAACHPIRLMADCEKYVHLSQPLITPASMLPEQIVERLVGRTLHDFGLSVQAQTFQFGKNFCVLPTSIVTAYALAIATSGKAKRVLLAGLDGFSADDPRQVEMEDLLVQYQHTAGSLPLLSITPTRYSLNTDSVYAL